MTWTVLWCTGQVFCRMFINFGLSNISLVCRVRLQVLGRKSQGWSPLLFTLLFILGVHAINMTIPGDVNRVRFCLPGFPIGSLLFFHFWTLFFGSKSLSLAHTQEEEGVWGINFHFLEGGVSICLSIYLCLEVICKKILFALSYLFIHWFIHPFMLVWTHLHLFCTLDCNSLPCFLFCCLNFS